METLETLQSRIPTLQEWRDRATRKRILELEDQLADTDAKEDYLESLIASANVEIRQQQKRIYELERRLLDSDKITTREIGRQQAHILELESKLGDADRTYLYWRGETLMLEKRLFKLMEDTDKDRGEIERLNRMLLKALEPILLLEE